MGRRGAEKSGRRVDMSSPWRQTSLVGAILQLVVLYLSSAQGQAQRSQVLELTADTFAAAIAKYDVIFVEFYAPWCGHCKHLAPEFEKAAQRLYPDVTLAKIDADKYTTISSKYDISGYPTLRLFTNGFPTETEYEGPRSTEALVSYVRRAVAPAISSLSSDAELNEYLKNTSDSSPIFLGFGLESSVLEKSASKHKKKAWFAVVQDFSEKTMMEFDFDKKPALVVSHSKLMEQSVFYGPFEGNDVEEFIQQNLMPLVTALTYESLKHLREDGRPIALGIIDSQADDEYKYFVKKLKAAAPANRPFVFAYVDMAVWPMFVKPFGIGKSSILPTMVIWNGLTEFSLIEDEGAFAKPDAEAQLTRFLHDYKENRVKRQQVIEPSFMERARDVLLSFPTLYMVITIGILVWVLQGCNMRDFMNHGDLVETQDRIRKADLEGEAGAERGSGAVGEPQVPSKKNDTAGRGKKRD